MDCCMSLSLLCTCTCWVEGGSGGGSILREWVRSDYREETVGRGSSKSLTWVHRSDGSIGQEGWGKGNKRPWLWNIFETLVPVYFLQCILWSKIVYTLRQYSSFSLTLLYAPSGTCVCINPIGGDGPRQPLSRGPRNRVTPWRHNGGNYPRDTHRTYVYTLPYVALVGQIMPMKNWHKT